MKKHIFFLSTFLLILICSPALAVEEIRQDHIKYFSLDAPEGQHISSVELYNLEPNSNTTIHLDNYGETYTLKINNTKTWGFWWNFDISLTTPNGTTEHKTLKSGSVTAHDYDILVQYYFQTRNNSLDTSYFDIDLYTGILPLEATLQDFNPTKTSALAFSQVTATSTSYFDLISIIVTPEEFEKQKNNDPLAPLQNLAKDLFIWTWDTVVLAISKIPYVGTHLTALLIITALTIDSIIFYTNLLFIEYAETTFLTIELFILSYSFCKKGTFWTKLKRVVNSHIQLIEIILNIARSAVNLFSSLINAIAQMINAIKPV